jgi:hypothetical protein
MPTTLTNPCKPYRCKANSKVLKMRAGTKGVDSISITDRVNCVYPSTTNWEVFINNTDLPGIKISKYDINGGRVFFESPRGLNLKKTTSFIFTDGKDRITCPLEVEVYSCNL